MPNSLKGYRKAPLHHSNGVALDVRSILGTGLDFELDLDGTTKERVTARITCEPSGKVFVLPNSVNDDATGEVLLELHSALPDQSCCRIELSGGAVGWLDFKALLGDVDRDGSVTTADIAAIAQRLKTPPNHFDFRFDLDADGVVTTADVSSTHQRLGNTAPACP